jgi:hypothetical protein
MNGTEREKNTVKLQEDDSYVFALAFTGTRNPYICIPTLLTRHAFNLKPQSEPQKHFWWVLILVHK